MEVGLQRVCQLIAQDPWRMRLLVALSQQDLPQAYIAAGFIRNCVWDHLHDYKTTPLNDVDVIFFDQSAQANDRQSVALQALQAAVPEVRWQIKNQAIMHIRNSDPAYQHCLDAISYWPELETAVAIRLDANKQLELLAPYGVNGLLAGTISHNVKRDINLFWQRVNAKQWLQHWPKLRLCY